MINDDLLADVRPLILDICAKTGASEQEVIRSVSKITNETSMKALAALERSKPRKPCLSLVCSNDDRFEVGEPK